MAGLFSNIGRGLFGSPDPNVAAYQMPQVPWGQRGDITAMALAAFAGPNFDEAMKNVAQVAPAAMAANTAQRRDMYSIQEKNAERARQTAAMNAGLKIASGIPLSSLTPAEQAAYAGSPEVALQFETLKRQPVGETWSPLTDPAARLAAGIPATDARTALVSSTGDIKFPGASGTTINVGGEPLTPGRKKADETFAADYVEWTSGGFTDAQRQIQQLEGVVTKLKSGQENLTGPIAGNIPDWLQTVVNPEAVDVRESVEEVVQRNLRLILGPQFTEKEGERLIARAYNPLLSEKENAARVERLLNQIKRAAVAKQSAADYFADNGTLTGWEGKLPSIDDFDPEGGSGTAGSTPTSPVPASDYFK